MTEEALKILDQSGSWASVIGFPITIIGICITLYQISKTKKASVAAKIAVQSFRDDFSQTVCLSDLTKALTGIEELKRLLRNEIYKLLPDRLAEVRQLLIAVRGTASGLSEEEEIVFQDAISELRSLELKIATYISTDSVPRNINKTTDGLIRGSDNLHVIMTRLKNQIGGKANGL